MEDMNEQSGLGTGDAMSLNGGGAATSPPPDSSLLVDTPDTLSDADQQNVSTVSLLADALQVPMGDVVRMNKDGTPRKKRGRKLGGHNATPFPSATTQAIAAPKQTLTPAQKAQVKLTAEATAKLMLNSAVGVMVQLVGPEWDFQSQEEADAMKQATAAYIEAKGGVNMSPEVCLLLAVSGYSLGRMQHQNTQAKFSAFFGKVWAEFTGLFKRR
jgi:hypothetical protein